MLITKDEATAAQRTFVFYAVDATDGFTPETAIDFSDAGDVKLSKAGGALANATGVVTELATGLYKLVLSAGDVDTLGDLVVLITNAGVRPIVLTHQVIALDVNVATVNPAAGGITAASFAAGAIDAAAIAANAFGASELAADAATEVRVGLATAAAVSGITLATKTVNFSLGTLDGDGSTPGVSILDALDATVTAAGTWDGASVTIEVCEDPSAAVPVWTAFDDDDNDNPLTANGSVVVTGAHNAVRATMSNDGAASDVDLTVAIRKPAGA